MDVLRSFGHNPEQAIIYKCQCAHPYPTWNQIQRLSPESGQRDNRLGNVALHSQKKDTAAETILQLQHMSDEAFRIEINEIQKDRKAVKML